MKSHLEFIPLPTTGKTLRFDVRNTHFGEGIGVIGWYTRWRRYVFQTHFACTLDASCLADIQTKLNELMDDRKKSR